MRRPAAHLLALSLCVLTLQPLWLRAEPDPLQLRLLEHYRLPLRWEAVEGAPYWLAGKAPHDGRLPFTHSYIDLAPGEYSLLRLPRDAHLRLQGVDSALDDGDLDIALSDGSGLERHVAPKTDRHSQALLIPASPDGERLARITRPSGASGELRLAVYLGITEPLPNIAPYRQEPHLPGEHHTLRLEHHATGQHFQRLQPGQTTELTVVGPARLRLESRLRYDERLPDPAQTYFIDARLDDAPLRSLRFDSRYEGSQRIEVDACQQPLAALETAYLDIPAGEHRLSLSASADIYLRPLQLDPPDYLLPRANRPGADPADSYRTQLTETLPAEAWRLDLSALQRVLDFDATRPLLQLRAAERLWRDNRHREGGLAAAVLARRTVRQRPDDPELVQAARRMENRTSSYRDLLPTNAGNQRSYWYLRRQLAPWQQAHRDLHLYRPHLAAALGKLGHGQFTGLTQALDYRLPTRGMPGRLRLAVRLQGGEQARVLWLQYDAQPPQRLTLQPGPALPTAAYRPDATEAALALQLLDGGAPAALTLDGPFALQAQPAPRVEAATTELPLPAEVSRLRIWSEKSGKTPLAVALQMRHGRGFQLGETDYLRLQDALGQERLRALFVDSLSARAIGDEPRLRDLDSHWQPLLRMLQGRARAYRAQVRPVPPSSTEPLAATTQTRLRRAALQAQTEADNIAALAHWSRLARQGSGEIRRQAMLARVELLLAEGEEFLAERQLRGIVLFDHDPQLRRAAAVRLLAHYRDNDQPENRLSLLATLALAEPTAHSLQALVEPLFDEGMDALAFDIALLLPDSEAVIEQRLRGAYLAGWWQLFERQLEELTNSERRHFWLGYRAQRLGREDEALAHWRQAGPAGGALSVATETGRTIAEALASEDAGARARALTDWQRWQVQHPGPQQWRNAAELVSDAAGNIGLRAIERDLLFDSFLAHRAKPLKLRVHGPLQLRLEARLLHRPDETEARNGWLELQHGGVRRVLAIGDSTPVKGLNLADGGALIPGNRTVMHYWVGAGEHELSLHAGEQDALFRVQALRPAMPLAVLPPLSDDTLRALTQAPQAPLADAAGSCLREACIQVLSRCGQPLQRLPRVEPAVSDRAPDRPTLAAVPSSTLQLGRRDGVALPDDDAALADYLQALSDQTPLARMQGLLWRAEQRPADAPQLMVPGDDLYQRNKPVSGLGSLRRRLLAQAGWQLVANLQSSAGVRLLELDGWRPESPEARVRQALLGLDDPALQVLNGHERLGLRLIAHRPGRLTLHLELFDTPYLTPQPMTVGYRIDQGEERRLQLDSGMEQASIPLDYPAGEHVLALRLLEPTIGQFLAVRADAPGLPGGTLSTAFERSYHVATRHEPVRLRLPGPVRLRIDELRDGRLLHSYRQLAAGWQALTLMPPEGRSEALLRIHRLDPRGAGPKAGPRQVEETVEAPPPALLQLPTLAAAGDVRLHDAHAPGGQEDGTWSLAARLARSKPLGVNSDGETLIDDFVELAAGHRYFAEAWNTWFETEALYRLHRLGNPTTGLKEKIHYEPEWLPAVALSLSWEGYTQRTGGPAWSSTWRLGAEQTRWINEKTYHKPAIEFFHRTLEQGGGFDYEPGEVDPDVLSEYSYLHPQGVTLSDTLTHSPWLDTQWWASLSLTSDEDWDLSKPENLKLSAGWRQMAGDIQLDLDYRLVHYFAEGSHVWRRPESAQSHDLSGRLLWDLHGVRDGRLQLALELGLGLDDGDYSAGLGVTWLFDRGRGYRDFRPPTISFRSLRERRLQQADMNRIQFPLEDD